MVKATEYVEVDHSQQIYGKRNLLYCEMGLLSTTKRYQKYKKLRKQELALKTLLKRALSEIHEELRNFNSLLPETKHSTSEKFEISKGQKKREDLESEIDDIKRKIAELQ